MNTKYKDWSEEIGNLWRHLRGILSASEAIALQRTAWQSEACWGAEVSTDTADA